MSAAANLRRCMPSRCEEGHFVVYCCQHFILLLYGNFLLRNELHVKNVCIVYSNSTVPFNRITPRVSAGYLVTRGAFNQ